MPATKKMANPIEKSPLLSEKKPSPTQPTTTSTINPSKLDHARFSEMREGEEGGNSLRIIVYVIVVILVGVGSALLIRSLITNNQQEQPPVETGNEDTSTPEVEETSAFLINSGIMEDSKATNLGSLEDYLDSEILALGDSTVDMTEATLDQIIYTDYETFSRLEFDLTTAEGKLPKTNLTFDSANNLLTVEFVGLVEENVDATLMDLLEADSLVDTIEYVSTDDVITFNITLAEAVKYRVLANRDNLIIDFKTLEQLDATSETPVQEEETETPTETTPPATTPPTTSDAEKPAAPHYTNEFSQSKQYISSALATDTITVNNYYVWDQGTFFEFSWAEEGQKGDSYVPNAVAYAEMKDGKDTIVVEVSNLKSVILKQNSYTAEEIASTNGFTMAGANFVRVDLESFDAATGQAIFRIELKKKADFKLLSQLTYNSSTQITSIQIKD